MTAGRPRAELIQARTLPEAFLKTGMEFPGEPRNGKPRRFGRGLSGYLMTLQPGESAAFGDWRENTSYVWRRIEEDGEIPSPAERAEVQRKAVQARKAAEAARDEGYGIAARKCGVIWDRGWHRGTATQHPYLDRKGIKAHGIHLAKDGRIMVPVRGEDGEICSLQYIADDGDKRFYPGGRTSGGWCLVGTVKPDSRILIAEGYATAASIHEATGHPVFVAFNAGNLLAVAKYIRNRYKGHQIVVCGDDDRQTEGNPGRNKAEQAARAIEASVVFPRFKGDTGSDFNDMHLEQGLEAVQMRVEEMIREAEGRADSFDAADLVEMDMADPVYLCRPWITEGITLLVGRPKIGKTTLVRQLLVALNTGGKFFSAPCDQAKTLLLSMEEGSRLMRKKLRGVFTADQLRGITIEFKWPGGMDGVKAIRERLQQQPDIQAVVIDSLSRFRPPPSRDVPQFQQDYNAIKWLAELGKEFPGLAVIVLHHTTKANPEDPVAAISGTYGLTAAADNYLVLLLQNNRFRLHAGGRLWEGDQADYELSREGGKWELIGPWEQSAAELTPQQAEALAILRREGMVSGAGIASRLGITRQTASEMMNRMADKGLVFRTKDGWSLQQ